MENWKDIPGFEGRYQASDEGNIRGLRSGLVLKPKILCKNSKYKSRHRRVVNLWNGRFNMKHVAHLILLSHVGPRPEGFQASHLNGDNLDDRLCNLAWETPRQNCARQVFHGTRKLMGKRKLDERGVIAIRRLLREGKTQRSVALTFGVHEATISYLAKGKSWLHVKE